MTEQMLLQKSGKCNIICVERPQVMGQKVCSKEHGGNSYVYQQQQVLELQLIPQILDSHKFPHQCQAYVRDRNYDTWDYGMQYDHVFWFESGSQLDKKYIQWWQSFS